jgi:flagellar M-ring protein FliF
MRAAGSGVLALTAALLVLFVVRPMLKGVTPASAVAVIEGALAGPGAAGAAAGQLTYDPQTGAALAIAGPSEMEQRIDLARIEGQVKASSVKKLAEFVEGHPDESVGILRSWLQEA